MLRLSDIFLKYEQNRRLTGFNNMRKIGIFLTTEKSKALTFFLQKTNNFVLDYESLFLKENRNVFSFLLTFQTTQLKFIYFKISISNRFKRNTFILIHNHGHVHLKVYTLTSSIIIIIIYLDYYEILVVYQYIENISIAIWIHTNSNTKQIISKMCYH